MRSSHCLAVGKMFQAFNAIVQMLSNSGSKVALSLFADFSAGAPPTADPQGSHVMDCGPDGNVRTPAHLLLFCDLYRACANEICFALPMMLLCVCRMYATLLSLWLPPSLWIAQPRSAVPGAPIVPSASHHRGRFLLCVCACFCRPLVEQCATSEYVSSCPVHALIFALSCALCRCRLMAHRVSH